MGTSRLPVVFFLIVGAVSGQQSYGPPGYQPGIPIGSDGDTIVKTEGYEIPDGRSSGYRGPSSLSSAISDSVSLSYGAPSVSGRSESYGAPSQPASSPAYGVPGIGTGKPLTSYKNPLENARYQVVPESSLPEQHSNLIRYIVLKEFAVSPNGTITPMDPEGVSLIGKTALTAGGGRGSGEVEILKVQMPGSGEAEASKSAAGGSNVAYGPPGYPAGKPNGDENNDIDDDNDDYDGNSNGEDYDEGDYDDDGNVDNNSVSSGGEMQRTAASGMASFMPGTASGEGMQVVPARGVALNNARRQSQQNKQSSSETEAFMFSDPASGEMTSSRRQSTASFNVNSPSLNINAQAQSGGVRNALRNAGNRIRPNRNRNNRNRNRNRNRMNRNRNNNRNRGTQNRVIGGTAASSAAAGPGTMTSAAAMSAGGEGGAAASGASVASQMAEIQTALNLISTYLEQMKQAGGLSSSLSAPGATSGRGSTFPFNIIPDVGGSGPYPASGQSASGASASASASSGGGSNNDAIVITSTDSTTPTQTTFPASTYGPPPGSPGFSLQAGSVFPQIADTISRPLQQAAGLKSNIVNQLVSGLTNGIRNLGAQASVAGNAAASSATTPSPVYGAPAVSGLASGNPAGLLRTVKGGIVNTVVSKGRAAVGIAGAKGQLIVNQVGTGANLVTKGLSQSIANKHLAFQSIVNHIQSIFNSNANLRNTGTW